MISSRILFLFRFKHAKMHRGVKRNSICCSRKHSRKSTAKKVKMIIAHPRSKISHNHLTNFINFQACHNNPTNPSNLRIKINNKQKSNLALSIINNKWMSNLVRCRINNHLQFQNQEIHVWDISQLNQCSLQAHKINTCIKNTVK